MAAANIPPAPKLSLDATLIVFVHHTAPPANDPVFGDCDRLRLLGRSALRAAYAIAVLNRHPNIHGQAFQVRPITRTSSRRSLEYSDAATP